MREVLTSRLALTSYRRLGLFVAIMFLLLARTSSAPISSNQSAAPVLPQGMTNHGDPNLLCSPSTWHDIAIFILVNYVAHAATVITRPGEPAVMKLAVMTLSLLFPTSGVLRGIQSSVRAAVFQKTDLDTARRAGALCAVVRTVKWQPHSKHKIKILGNENSTVRDRKKLSVRADGTHEAVEMDSRYRGGLNPSLIKRVKLHVGDTYFSPPTNWYDRSGYNVHGICVLPPGYALGMLRPQVDVWEMGQGRAQNLSPGPTITHDHARATGMEDQHQSFYQPCEQNDKPPTIQLSTNFNVPKALIAITQLIYASVTLYKSRGDQIERYGYAAFGLSVIPYLIMSFMNLAGNVLTPDYPKAYLVHSTIMDEAKQCPGARFEGVVGTIEPPPYSLNASQGGSEEAAEDSVIVGHVTNHNANDTSEAILETNSEGRLLLLRGNNCPAEEVVFDTSYKKNCPERTRRFPITVAAGPNPTGENSSALLEFLRLRCGSLFVGCLAIFINAGMTHFKPGGSTPAQRACMMIWLTVGIAWGLNAGSNSLRGDSDVDRFHWRVMNSSIPWTIARLAFLLVLTLIVFVCAFAPCIGGFVVVVQMLSEYGSCNRIPGG